MKRALSNDVGLGVGNRHLRGGGLALRGSEGHLDGIKAVLQLAHLVGSVEKALAGLVRPMDELPELLSVIRG